MRASDFVILALLIVVFIGIAFLDVHYHPPGDEEMNCCVCKKAQAHGDFMLCEECLKRFRKDPDSLKKAPPPERKQPENKPSSGGKSAGVPYLTAGR